MRLLERVELAAVVEAFLSAELTSERFGDAVRDALRSEGADDALVTHADLGDAAANTRRHAVLRRYRGAYLGTLLDELVWHRAELEPDEVLGIRFIAWDYWLEITDGSRLPVDAAARLRARGEELRYAGDSPPLILIRAHEGTHLVVVEGHVRLTALAMVPERIPPRLEVLLGEGEPVGRWPSY